MVAIDLHLKQKLSSQAIADGNEPAAGPARGSQQSRASIMQDDGMDLEKKKNNRPQTIESNRDMKSEDKGKKKSTKQNCCACAIF